MIARARRLAALLAFPTAGGRDAFAASHSVLDPAGVQAERLARLWWLFFWVCAAAFAVVMAVLVAALVRRRDRGSAGADPALAPAERVERGLARGVKWATAAMVIALAVLLAADFMTRGGLARLAGREQLAIKVTGHQWWWQFEYLAPVPSDRVTTANEIHLPVGRVVRFELVSNDVIHSFWIPNLHGKRDLVPGKPTRTFLRADRPGTYIGECAEFCGHQHATMRFVTVVEPEDRFERWLAAQRRPAPPPATDRTRRGQEVFLGATCAMCHAIQGTTALSRVGPDLTHLASRSMIASATLPNVRGHLAGWITDPQRVRPGVRMPPTIIAPADLQAMLDYLETLR